MMTSNKYYLNVKSLNETFVDVLNLRDKGFTVRPDFPGTTIRYVAIDENHGIAGIQIKTFEGLAAGDRELLLNDPINDPYYFDIRLLSGSGFDLVGWNANGVTVKVYDNNTTLRLIAIAPTVNTDDIKTGIATGNVVDTRIDFAQPIQTVDYFLDVFDANGTYVEIVNQDENGFTVRAMQDGTTLRWAVVKQGTTVKGIYCDIVHGLAAVNTDIEFTISVDYTDKLFRYLAKYVNQKAEITIAIIKSVGSELAILAARVKSLDDTSHVVYGLYLEADEWHILRSGRESQEELQNLVSQRFQLHQRRGTTEQIILDVRRIMGDPGAIVSVSGEPDAGWWLDRTYPEHGYHTFSDAGNLIVIDADNNSRFQRDELRALLVREVIPISFTTVFI